MPFSFSLHGIARKGIFPLNPPSNEESLSTQCIDLPVDVWFHIASFIPFSMFVQYKLYAINRGLLEFYLREKHKFINISFTCGFFKTSSRKRLERYIRDLKENNLRTYNAKSLTITFRQDKFSYTANKIPTGVRSTYLKRKGQLLDYFPRVKTTWMAWKRDEALKNFPSLENMSAAVSQMQNLTSISFALECFDWKRPIIPFEKTSSVVSAAWTASQASLTSLDLKFTLASLPPLCLDDVFFPNLRKFSLVILLLPNTTAEFPFNVENFNRTKEPLLKFFSRHRHQIVDFSFTFPTSRCLADLLDGTTFSGLKNLSLTFAMQHNAPILGPLASFLSHNSANVEKLTLNLFIDTNVPVQPGTDGPPWMSNRNALRWWRDQPMFHVPFPSLKSLSLRCLTHPILFIIYPIGLTAPLKALHMHGFMPYNSVVLMIRAFARYPIGRTLKRLQIYTEALSPKLLRILADGLPHLKTLCLSHKGVGHDDKPQLTVTTLLPVYESIASVDLSKWKLEYLELCDRLDVWCSQTETFREAVVKILPSVKSFNGLNQSEYIRFGGRTSPSFSFDVLFTLG